MKKTTESQLVHVILSWLKIAKPKGVFWRSNCGSMRVEAAGRRPRYVRFGVPGMADIEGLCAGHAYYIECKSATGRLSPAQVVFGEAIKGAGGTYIIARTLDDVIAGFG